jgi:hypothetical protein
LDKRRSLRALNAVQEGWYSGKIENSVFSVIFEYSHVGIDLLPCSGITFELSHFQLSLCDWNNLPFSYRFSCEKYQKFLAANQSRNRKKEKKWI